MANRQTAHGARSWISCALYRPRRFPRRGLASALAALVALAAPVASAQDAGSPTTERAAPADASQGGLPVYRIDPAHSSVLFAVSHLGFAAVQGRFNKIDGRIAFDPDRPEASTVTATLQAASVDTGHDERDEALRSERFLAAQANPKITFESQSVTVTGKKRGEIAGTLAIAGVERRVTLNVVFNRMGQHPLAKELAVVGFTARTQIQRSNFGIDFATPQIGDTVEVQINVEALRRQRQN